ncbi:MAG: glutamate--tRNA ligase family protein [Patescibacteria group bacterium]
MPTENKENLKKLAQTLLPEATLSIEEITQKYPPRNLPDGAMVTRIAPSPTGFMHIGNLYAALIPERLGHQSGGIFYLRVEDTDRKREVEGAIELVVNSLKTFNINIDEGQVSSTEEIGNYGPYKQSERKNIYQAFVKKLLESGDAYPAFETIEELASVTENQTNQKLAPGYYGEWATWRYKSVDDALAALNKGLTPVIRLKSTGDLTRIIAIEDLFKGKLRLPENNQDIVILKSDGLPTYHFAHVIDDHFMGTTHVLRGDEWLASLALHIQLFTKMGWEHPVYGHIAPIQKLDGSSRRKLSKRHDPEANVAFYEEAGYPTDVVIMYLLNLANSGFEKWLNEHPDEDLANYKLSVAELKKGAGALLDLQKMDSFGKEYIGRMSAKNMTELGLAWAKKYDADLASLIEADINYTIKILNIERENIKARKDISKWSDLRAQIGFFFDSIFKAQGINMDELAGADLKSIKEVATSVADKYNPDDDKETWLQKMRTLSVELGYAPDAKTFKESPEKYKGNFGDMAKIIRVLLVGKNQSPDLYEMMQAMGVKRVNRRLTSNIWSAKK